jgi:glucokinase
MTEPAFAAVMDVGGSHATAAVIGGDPAAPRVLAKAGGDLDATADRARLLDALLAPARALGAPPLPWMIALPGPFDYARGTGSFAGVGKFGAIAGLDLAATLAPGLGAPAEGIRFVNDAAAFAMGEWSAAEHAARFVGITLGTGVGSGFLRDGVPVDSGPGVPPSGWVHLLEADGVPLERRVSTAAIVADFAAHTGRTRSVAQIAEHARAGDPVAREVWERVMSTLGRVLAPCLAAFDADELVIGGGMSRSWDLVAPALREAMVRAAPALERMVLRPAALGDDAALVGAGVAAARR